MASRVLESSRPQPPPAIVQTGKRGRVAIETVGEGGQRQWRRARANPSPQADQATDLQLAIYGIYLKVAEAGSKWHPATSDLEEEIRKSAILRPTCGLDEQRRASLLRAWRRLEKFSEEDMIKDEQDCSD